MTSFVRERLLSVSLIAFSLEGCVVVHCGAADQAS